MLHQAPAKPALIRDFGLAFFGILGNLTPPPAGPTDEYRGGGVSGYRSGAEKPVAGRRRVSGCRSGAAKPVASSQQSVACNWPRASAAGLGGDLNPQHSARKPYAAVETAG